MKQMTRTTDFEEMESKMQEKDLINQNLEERIRLLQTRIVTAANCNNTISQSFKNKEKRRRTWCGTGGYNKFNASLLPMCANLSPIKEMSPVKYRKSANMNTCVLIFYDSTQIEYFDKLNYKLNYIYYSCSIRNSFY